MTPLTSQFTIDQSESNMLSLRESFNSLGVIIMWRTILIGMLFLAVSRPLMAQNDYATHFSKGRDIYLKANTLTGEEARELYRQAIEELVLARKIADKAGAKYYHALCLYRKYVPD